MRPLSQRPRLEVSNSNALTEPGPLLTSFSTAPKSGRSALAIQSPANPTCNTPSACRTVNRGLVASAFTQPGIKQKAESRKQKLTYSDGLGSERWQTANLAELWQGRIMGARL